MRYWGREQGEAERRCPSCGGDWVTPAPEGAKGLAWFDFRCELCRLVSHLADSFESKARAAIGEWCSRNERRNSNAGGTRASAWVVQHVAREDTDDEDVKFIGVYSSEAKARLAVKRLRMQPGFSAYPSSFHVERYGLDQDHWTEGFFTDWV
jgi:hypothetical protein